MGWQLPAMRCTTLGTADVPTVSSSGRGDQLLQVAQSAELPVARAGRPSRAAAERRGCGIPRRGKRAKEAVVHTFSSLDARGGAYRRQRAKVEGG